MQTGVTIRSEEVLRKIFFELSTEIITTETEQVSGQTPINSKLSYTAA